MATASKPKRPSAKPAAKSSGKGGSSKPKAAKPAPKPSAKKKTTAKPPAAAPKKPAPKVEIKKGKQPAPAKPAPAKGSKSAPTPKAAAAPAAAATGAAGDKKTPKGITIVNQKQVRKNKPKPKLEMPRTEPLIRPGQKWKPLIPSGPKAPPSPYGVWRSPDAVDEAEFKIDPKAKLPKKELERYREILILKRRQLIGDISTMEEEALRTNSGSLSSLPQHMAEQGSDTFDQSLSLDLAAADRTILREIDDALRRIEDGTYGVCMKTGKRISAERLAEIPWARYSIEAAREMERFPVSSSSISDSSGGLDND